MAKTLGVSFFAADVLEPAAVNGEDSGEHKGVTPERFSKLEKELVRGKGEVTKRLQQLSMTMTQIDWLYSELGKEPPSVDDLSSHSSSSLSVPRSTLNFSTSISSDPLRTSTPRPSVISPDDSEDAHMRIFARFIARHAEAAEEDLPHPTSSNTPLGLESVDPTPSLVAWANRLCSSLEDLKKRRETHIQAMYDQLEALWRRLGVEEGDMDAFVEMNRGSTEDVVRAYEEELERMIELKRERMGTFVANARDEIVRLWDDLMTGEEERGAFAPFVDGTQTDHQLYTFF